MPFAPGSNGAGVGWSSRGGNQIGKSVMAPTSISTRKSAGTQVNCTGVEVTARMPYRNSDVDPIEALRME
jgi:hypothetical protein